MDYYLLTEIAIDLGYELAMCGAETFRVEESIIRILRTYGIECEVFAIPNCLTLSFEAANGKPMTRMRRVGFHGNNLEGVERFNALSRRICAEKPEPEVARQWLNETRASCRIFSLPVSLLGYFCAAFGFALFFGSILSDCVIAGLCGVVMGLLAKGMDALKANPFFSTFSSAFAAALIIYLLAPLGIVQTVDGAIIGTMMILVPGIALTYSMRDIIYGDTNSGLNRIVQVVMLALAIALGTAVAWSATIPVWGRDATRATLNYPEAVQCLAAFIGCIGFAILFNVHGTGMWLCTFGGILTWVTYLIASALGSGVIAANFWAAAFASAYAESLARIRKFPATAYLVVSAIPLFPGAGIYYTTTYALQKNTSMAMARGFQTAGIAGAMAVGILLMSTIVRLITTLRYHMHAKK